MMWFWYLSYTLSKDVTYAMLCNQINMLIIEHGNGFLLFDFINYTTYYNY